MDTGAPHDHDRRGARSRSAAAAAARGACVIAVLGACIASLVVLHRGRTGADAGGLPWDDSLRREVQSIVSRRYVDKVDEARARRLFDDAMRGYVASLDPYSRFYPASERRDLDQRTSGSFGGIGVMLGAVPGGLRVNAVRKGGPADRAGIAPGDVIERVGGHGVEELGFDGAVAAVKGPVGTTATLVLRGSPAPRTVEVARADVPADTVPGVRLLAGDPPVGYVRIEQFTDGTGRDARAAFEDLAARGAAAFVLDLRQNLGGVVRAAEAVASIFLPPDTVVCVTRRRDGSEIHRTKPADGAPLLVGGSLPPLVALVDEQSASASEILAGALQDHGRALLVGERTYGKFFVQSLVETSSGGAVVGLTTSRHETPLGRSGGRDGSGEPGGLLPDVRVPIGGDGDRDLLRAVFGRQAGPAWVLHRREAQEPPPDRQLAAALSLLRGGLPPAEPVVR
ncbi:MAG: putative CtpA-like serine protease [Planctomycetes bacterium]|nr:putative CtpA-like serine protease [Planctomycetota bacterium]